MVSSIRVLLGAASRAAPCSNRRVGSNSRAAFGIVVAMISASSAGLFAQEPASGPNDPSTGKRVASFLGGGAAGLGLHEAGHLIANAVFGEKPTLKKVDFHGIPFFAITHRSGLPRHEEFIISSAGFWMQHAENEWLLSRQPPLRARGDFLKGLFTFNIVASGAYAGAAFAKTGPVERDTRGIAESSRVDERWIGALLLAPAVLDAWRYFHPDSKWATWSSRGAKIGMVLLIVR
jgi:hypothetical protein